MEILVNHLTRMKRGFICVAGVGVADGQHVRPVLRAGRLPTSMLGSHGGVFDLGATVDLGAVEARPVPPEIEDHVFEQRRARRVADCDDGALWATLEALASPSLCAVFGPALSRDGYTASTPEGEGQRSLGVIRPAERPALTTSFGSLKLRLTDPDLGELSVAVTDIRLFDPESGEIDRVGVCALNSGLRDCDVLLSVGLGRPWAKKGGHPRHWLQVNNIHVR